MSEHNQYMQRCIELAKNGLGNVAPNPMVGCVIVYKDQIIGEGYHQKYGKAHAEVNAINSVKDKSLLTNSRLYVNLEPCAHFGKTPPCSDLIVEYKIPEVIIGCVDSFSLVAGKGINRLRQAGISVICGVNEAECRELNKRFFTFHERKRPYVILKWAQTLDGFIDKSRESNSKPGINWISNKYSKILVHQWRTQEQAILVGNRTALNDNPQLNVRLVSGKSPLRMVLDKDLKLPNSLNLFDKSIPTLIFTQRENVTSSSSSCENIEYISIDFSVDIHPQINDFLYQKNIQSLIVEGGSSLLNSYIKNDLWDEARVIIGNTTFGSGLKAPVINLPNQFIEEFGDDKLIFFRNK